MTDSPRSEVELAELIAAVDVQAPPELHRRVQAMADEASARRSPVTRGARARPLGAVALVALMLVLVLVLGSSGGHHRLSVEQTATFTLSAATMTAPASDPSDRSQLAASVEGIAFPYWDERFGWTASGSRIDRAEGRTVRTVFYSDRAGRRVGYAIVAGSPAPSVGEGTVHWVGQTPYFLTRVGGAPVVSWIRDGHLCVVSGRGVPAATLLALAGWQEPASTA